MPQSYHACPPRPPRLEGEGGGLLVPGAGFSSPTSPFSTMVFAYFCCGLISGFFGAGQFLLTFLLLRFGFLGLDKRKKHLVGLEGTPLPPTALEG